MSGSVVAALCSPDDRHRGWQGRCWGNRELNTEWVKDPACLSGKRMGQRAPTNAPFTSFAWALFDRHRRKLPRWADISHGKAVPWLSRFWLVLTLSYWQWIVYLNSFRPTCLRLLTLLSVSAAVPNCPGLLISQRGIGLVVRRNADETISSWPSRPGPALD